MKQRTQILILTIFALPVLLSSCSSNGLASPTTSAAVNPTTTTSKSGLVPALQTHNPKVTVTPSRNLSNGQKVTVSVVGFGSGGKFYLSECADAQDANIAGCGPGLPAQPFGVVDSEGTGTFTFNVNEKAATVPNGKATEKCTTHCVIVASVGVGNGFAFAPIEFAAG